MEAVGKKISNHQSIETFPKIHLDLAAGVDEFFWWSTNFRFGHCAFVDGIEIRLRTLIEGKTIEELWEEIFN